MPGQNLGRRIGGTLYPDNSVVKSNAHLLVRAAQRLAEAGEPVRHTPLLLGGERRTGVAHELIGGGQSRERSAWEPLTAHPTGVDRRRLGRAA